MVRIGIIGLGFMGRMHIAAYQKIDGVKITAIADQDPRRAQGDFSGGWGNIEGAAESMDMTGVTGTTDYHALLNSPEVDAVDICVPTPLHEELAIAALSAGKHVLCEKPLALSSQSAKRIADAARSAKGIFMPAMCIRFWPEYAWLKQAVAEGRYGKVLDATFHRVAAMPAGWFSNGEISGGGILDLHVHDTDFVYHVFGKPQAVFSRGYTKTSGKIDAVNSEFIYEGGPHYCTVEGSWTQDDKFPFNMRWRVNFEKGTAEFISGRTPALVVASGGEVKELTFDGDGYYHELKYFAACCATGEKPTVVTADDAVESLRIVEAEAKSAETGQIVKL